MDGSQSWWPIILPPLIGLIGVLAGAAVAVFAVGYTEKKKEFAAKTVESYVEFIEDYIAFTQIKDPDEFERMGPERLKRRSSFAVFAKPETLRKFAEFRRCMSRQNGLVTDCPDEWVELVQSMRADTGSEPVDRQDIADTIFWPEQ